MIILKVKSCIHENQNMQIIQFFDPVEQLFSRMTFEMNRSSNTEAATSK